MSCQSWFFIIFHTENRTKTNDNCIISTLISSMLFFNLNIFTKSSLHSFSSNYRIEHLFCQIPKSNKACTRRKNNCNRKKRNRKMFMGNKARWHDVYTPNDALLALLLFIRHVQFRFGNFPDHFHSSVGRVMLRCMCCVRFLRFCSYVLRQRCIWKHHEFGSRWKRDARSFLWLVDAWHGLLPLLLRFCVARLDIFKSIHRKTCFIWICTATQSEEGAHLKHQPIISMHSTHEHNQLLTVECVESMCGIRLLVFVSFCFADCFRSN